ncbi:endolytic transglycosylase MltG [Dysgonomonas sp. Marseille-P4361]|uniref:endolytic transglycosylase MltG n=1 Tax=Dysgonomonas sp. Marseille-P4361 TaxID=2161820 RepID=UPI000D556AB8|nr:endolytic transglycosylase MltG [Dysgonomonas sp. Marseille-P4361]
MKKAILYILLILIVTLSGIALYGYSIINTGFNIDKPISIYIDDNRDYNRLKNDIRDSAKVENIANFDKLCTILSYKENIKTGRYIIKPEMTIYEVIKDLRSGHQAPIKLKFNNIRTKVDLADRVGQQMMFDSKDLLVLLNDSVACKELGFSTQDIPAMFIPNTYEIYWDISIKNFIQRMKKEYTVFWNEERKNKAKEINLTPIEVSTLASIVEEECTYSDEYPIVAGLYINRLNRGQALQADPTVKFAVGDFGLKRILNKHLEVDSPYNTYQHTGLPPGPIRIPSIKGIDAVLNYAKHDYLYMCAKDDFSGYHEFAKTFSEHQRNAVRYRQALDKRGIR